MMSTHSRDSNNSNAEVKSKGHQNHRNRNKKKTTDSNMDAPKLFPSNSIYTYQCRRYYKILVGNYGIEVLCKEVYRNLLLTNREDSDSDCEGMMEHIKINGPSEDQFIYVMIICHAYRCYTLGINLGYNQELDKQMSDLKKYLNYIYFPSILCDYIEGIGRLKLKNGITVVPWFAPAAKFYSPDLAQLTPAEILQRAGRLIPDNCWCINYGWISDFNKRVKVFNSLHTALKLEEIAWNNVNADIEMVITTEVDKGDNEALIPISNQKSLAIHFHRGAIYNYRRFSEQSNWPADTLKVCNDDFFYGEAVSLKFINLKVLSKRNNAEISNYISEHKIFCKIFVGNYGVEPLCRIVYNEMYAELPYIDDYISLEQLIYVVIMCHAERCCMIECSGGLQQRQLSLLYRIQLPSILCKYVEAIGKLQLKNGITVHPWGGPKAEFYSSELAQLTPEEILERAGRPIPDDSWCIDNEWIRDWIYNFKIPQFSLPWLQLREIDWTNRTGSSEMMITAKVDYDDKEVLIPTSPQKCLEVEAQRGAIYNFRRFSEQSLWPGQTSQFCHDFFRARGFIPCHNYRRLFSN